MAMTAARCATSFRTFSAAAAALRPPLRYLHPPSPPAAAAATLPSSLSGFSSSAAAPAFAAVSSTAAAAAVSVSAFAGARAARGRAARLGSRIQQAGTLLTARAAKLPAQPAAAGGVAGAGAVSPRGAVVPAAGAGAAAGDRSAPPLSSCAFSRGSVLLLRRSFAAAAAAAAARDGSSVSNRLLLTLSSPSEAIYIKTPVHSVTVPGSEGAMTLTNGHSQMVARLKAGEIVVRRDATAGGGGSSDAGADRYFVSDGFLLFSSPEDDSGCCTAEVLGIELVPVHVLDKERAVAVLQTLLQQGAAAADDWAKARTLLGQELLSTVIRVAS